MHGLRNFTRIVFVCLPLQFLLELPVPVYYHGLGLQYFQNHFSGLQCVRFLALLPHAYAWRYFSWQDLFTVFRVKNRNRLQARTPIRLQMSFHNGGSIHLLRQQKAWRSGCRSIRVICAHPSEKRAPWMVLRASATLLYAKSRWAVPVHSLFPGWGEDGGFPLWGKILNAECHTVRWLSIQWFAISAVPDNITAMALSVLMGERFGIGDALDFYFFVGTKIDSFQTKCHISLSSITRR